MPASVLMYLPGFEKEKQENYFSCQSPCERAEDLSEVYCNGADLGEGLRQTSVGGVQAGWHSCRNSSRP